MVTRHPDGTITYHALAVTPENRIGELLVTRVPRPSSIPGATPTVQASQEWTGRTWPNTDAGWRKAYAENERRNCSPEA